MIQETKLLGCLAQFALAGTTQSTPTPTGGPVVSNAFCPDNAAADASSALLWMPFGIISQADEMVKAGTTVKVFRPSPGSLVLNDIKESKFERTLKLKVEECSNFMWLTLRRALLITSPRTGAIGQHVPLTSGTIRGWLKFQSYNQDTNVQEIADQFWCALQISTAVTYGNDKQVMFDVDVSQLYSPLNTSTGS